MRCNFNLLTRLLIDLLMSIDLLLNCHIIMPINFKNLLKTQLKRRFLTIFVDYN